MNFEQARFNMIEQQIRPWEVLDPQVLELLFEVKRENFVPPEHREIAFADLEIPLGHGEAMMQPKVEARILQELALQPHETVYEVGTGSGYLTALLSWRARHVTSAEIHPDFKARAADNLRAAGISNVTLLEGDSA
ncbi:MAG: protein-L-isoaspartate O-methyltransferase family protein, partial [Usitatibacter sp.]